MPSPPYSAFRINCGPVPASATFELDLSVLPWNDGVVVGFNTYNFATDWSKTVEFAWFETSGFSHRFRATSNGKFLTLYLERNPTSTSSGTRLEFVLGTSGYPLGASVQVAYTWRNLAAESFWYWQPILWQSKFYVDGSDSSPLVVDRFQGIEIPVTRTDT